MKDFGFSGSASVGLVMIVCSLAMLFGEDPWLLARDVALCVPIVAYVVFTHVTMMWAMNVGHVDVRQKTTWQGRLYCWHGVSVVGCIVLAAAGSFIVFFAHAIRGL